MNARLTLDERAELDQLRRRVREQADELQAWRSQSADAECDYWRQRFNLPKSMGCVLGELVARSPSPVSKERLLDATAPSWRDHADAPVIKIVDVYVCRLRKRLEAWGYPGAITSHWGFGYSLSADVAAQIRPRPMEKAA